mmetsp:Transcript_14299/g.15523  ORF Transcript_14299/g.15523 Transcript_14299/m.15523 type:complete len:88 (-) Transcript_14299:329-592(-)
MFRPFLIVLLEVYLWAQEQTPTGYFHYSREVNHTSIWCIETDCKEIKSDGHVNISAICRREVRVDGKLQLLEEKRNLYEVTERGIED